MSQNKIVIPLFNPSSFQIACQFALGEFPYKKHIHYLITESESIVINQKTVKETRSLPDASFSKTIYDLSCSVIEFTLLNGVKKGHLGMSDLYVSNREFGVSVRLEKIICDEGPWKTLCDALRVSSTL